MTTPTEWQDRAERAEAELARLREQEPVAYCNGDALLSFKCGNELPLKLSETRDGFYKTPLYAAPPAQPAPETIADHERAYELLFKENARLRGRFEVAQDRAPLERFNLDCHYDGFDQMREFVLASDHDARVHDLETICDPAGIVTENALLKQTAKELVAMVNRLKRDAAQPAAQPVQPQGWQPIETAPKDGQEFVTANSMQGFVKELVSWNRIHGYWQSKGKSIHMQATHWMPLPARPGGAS